MIKRLLTVVVAVLSLASFTGAVFAQDSTSTAPSSGMTSTPKKTTKHHRRKHHARKAQHATPKADTTTAH